jgi:hypothetical protein
MWVPLLLLAAFACIGLIAALWPEAFTRYFLAEYQRNALSGQLNYVSTFGWVFFCSSVLVFTAFIFHSELNVLAPIVVALLFLACAAAYLWWGIWLVRSPDSFLKRAPGPLSRLPVWAVRAFGSVLLVGAIGFLYGFVIRVLR